LREVTLMSKNKQVKAGLESSDAQDLRMAQRKYSVTATKLLVATIKIWSAQQYFRLLLQSVSFCPKFCCCYENILFCDCDGFLIFNLKDLRIELIRS